ncbi:MAG: HlyD family efflux transporter periplasmic adaptor subunit [Candidatus Omnitrophica bacterium]|nr:HlyD family efflux transporter periplasmic adaptor subunit [Candidatus Omnitrophota bacterium]
MDVPRESAKRNRIIRRTVFGILTLVVVGGVTAALSRLEPAAPAIDRDMVWIDSVKRGDMLREVRGPGSLVPVDIRWIAPDTNGRVEKILVRPGTPVTKDTLIMELSNPELELSLEDAQLQLKSAESQLTSKKVELENQLLNLESAAAQVEANLAEAKLKAKADEELAKDGLISELQLQLSQVRAEELAKLKVIEEKRVKVQKQLSQTQLEVAAAQVDQAKAYLALKEKQVESLNVHAGFEGVLEQMLVEEGHQVTSVTNLAKVSDPTKLKAVLRIDQNLAREVKIGLTAKIDLRSSVLNGHVTRIDPAVQEGTVDVDVFLDDPLPDGARPDQTLDGNILIEQLSDVLHVGRPVFGQSNASIQLFKVSADGMTANRIRVQIGRVSVNTVEIVDGLLEGDRVVLTDMSEWDEFDKVRLR